MHNHLGSNRPTSDRAEPVTCFFSRSVLPFFHAQAVSEGAAAVASIEATESSSWARESRSTSRRTSFPSFRLS